MGDDVENLEDRIIRHEGFCSVAKPDAKGMYVIGFGHDLTPQEAKDYSGGITMQEGLELLEEDIGKAKIACAHAFPWMLGLDETRQSVILEMVFQLGCDGVENFHKMIAAIRDHDWPKAAKEMLNSEWYQQTPSRCQELADLMLNGGES